MDLKRGTMYSAGQDVKFIEELEINNKVFFKPRSSTFKKGLHCISTLKNNVLKNKLIKLSNFVYDKEDKLFQIIYYDDVEDSEDYSKYFFNIEYNSNWPVVLDTTFKVNIPNDHFLLIENLNDKSYICGVIDSDYKDFVKLVIYFRTNTTLIYGQDYIVKEYKYFNDLTSEVTRNGGFGSTS